MRKLQLGLVGALVALFCVGACSGALSDAASGAGAAGVGGSAGGGDVHGAWSLPGDQPSASAGISGHSPVLGTSGSSSSGATLSTGAGGAAPSLPDGGLPAVCDSWSTPPVGGIHLTLPGARAMASPALVRGIINAGKAPDSGAVHPSDFLNYYQVSYPGASNAGNNGLTAVAGVAPGTLANELVLQVGVQAPPAVSPRNPIGLTVVVDTSASMVGVGILRARAAATALAGKMLPGDTFTLVTSGTGAPHTILAVEQPADQQTALTRAGALAVDGGDDLATAVAEGYELAVANRPAGGVSRLVLITDGAAHPTAIDLGLVAGNFVQNHIPLIGVGVGEATAYESALVDAAALNGGGSSVYLDSPGEADRVLGQRFDELMGTVASDVELVLTLPSYLRIQSLGSAGVNGAPAAVATPDLGPGRSLVFRQVLEACVPIQQLSSGLALGIQVTWIPPGGGTPQSRDVSGTLSMLSTLAGPQIAKASAITAYADALASVQPLRLQAALTEAQQALQLQGLTGDADLTEIVGLLQHDPATNAAP